MTKFSTNSANRFVVYLFLVVSSFCLAQNKSETTNVTTTFAKGGDVSWLQQMETTGYKFYDDNGAEKDAIQLLKDKGINSIRLRVFVNPSTDKINGHCSPTETIAMAVRAKNMGMRIMIDFHYSDSWADPGHQTKPAAWKNHTFEELKNDVYNHTFDLLTDLKTAGVTPEWVQIGNEIPSGMLWPDGHTNNWSQLAQLLNKGYDAVKAVNATTKVVIHIDKGNDNARFRWFFDRVSTNNVKYDVIGMSYYPYFLKTDYTATINDLKTNLNDMAARYAKEVMVVEIGGDYTKILNTYDMLVAVIDAVKKVPNNKGLGVIYWEPQGEKSWSNYQLNAWQPNGKPSAALNAFSETLGPPVIEPTEDVKVNGFEANPVEQGKNVKINLTYTAKQTSNYFYVGLNKKNAAGNWLQTVTQSSGNQFLVPAIGNNQNNQISFTIPNNIPISANLQNGEYYEFEVQLWTENWGTKLATSQSPRLNIVTAGSLGINDLDKNSNWLIYPNPVVNILHFDNVDDFVAKSIRITNILGKEVFSTKKIIEKNTFDVSNLNAGVYFLTINSENEKQQFKFIKK